MKLHAKLFSLLLLILAGCSSAYHTAGTYDDVYYTPELVRPGADNGEGYTQANVVEAGQGTEEAIQTTDTEYVYDDQAYYDQDTGQTYVAEDGTVIVNNYYGSGYYDYAYSARLRRFYSPTHYSAAYYDPFFTNMYWYNFDPFYSGVSIYMGYGAMAMYYPGYFYTPMFYRYNPYRSMHMYHMAYTGLYGAWGPFSPYIYHMGYHAWPGYYGYNPYYSGYSHGFYSGMYFNPYYYQYIYNSFDPNNYHYGHRGSVGGGTMGRALRPETTFAERFEGSTIRTANGSRELIARDTRENVRSTAGVRQATGDRIVRDARGGEVTGQRQGDTRGTGTEITQPRPQSATRQGSTATTRTQEATRTTRTETSRPAATPVREGTQPARTDTRPSEYQAPARGNYERPAIQRYERPQQATRPSTQERVNQPNYNPPRTYTSPSYQQPRSTDQFRNPQATRTPALAPPREATQPSRDQAQPQRQQVQPQARPQTTPQRQERGQPSYSTPPRQQSPQRSTPNVRTAPSRNTAPAVRSVPSNTGTRSTGVSSSPSRNTGSSASPSRSTGSSSSSGSRSGGSSSSSSGGRR